MEYKDIKFVNSEFGMQIRRIDSKDRNVCGFIQIDDAIKSDVKLILLPAKQLTRHRWLPSGTIFECNSSTDIRL